MSDTLQTVKPKKSRKNGAYTNMNNNKIIPALISKPEQGKKTIEMCRIMDNDLNKNEKILSFLITQNRRNQANQANNTFTKFMSFFEYDEKMINHEDKIDILHGEKCCSTDPDGFVRRAEVENKRLLIALSNKSRLTIVRGIIVKWIASSPTNMVKIYIDEAGDTSTLNSFLDNVWEGLEEQISDLNKVKPIFIDAHCSAIMENKKFQKYFPLETIHKLENHHDLENYMYFSSLPYKIHEWENMSCIVESYSKRELVFEHDDYVLLPLSYKKEEQYEEASEFVESVENCVVLVINGDGYHIFVNDSPMLTLSKKSCGKKRHCNKETCPKCFPSMEKEINVVKFVKKKYASNKTFCLGGNHCIDRAMTYQDPTLQFSKALITTSILKMNPFSQDTDYEKSSTTKKESVSQRVKRICHSFGNGKQATYYGPQEIYNGICRLEQNSTFIANQTGYITPKTIDKMDEGENPTLETVEEIQEYENERNPYDYYLATFNLILEVDTIHRILSTFKTNIGGKNIQTRTIERRMNGMEPDDNLSHLSLRNYEETISTLKTALDIETSNSRVRVTKDKDGNIVWIIHYLTRRNTIIWDGNTYKLIIIPKDGNDLFNSFVNYSVLDIESVKKMRREVSMELRTQKDKYDKRNIDEEEWDDKCDKIKIANNWDEDIFDYCMVAISEKYDINIIIFKIETLKCGGYKMLYDKPTTIPEEKNKTNTIHLRKLDDHYDLLKIDD
jgi:hypothetical protein